MKYAIVLIVLLLSGCSDSDFPAGAFIYERTTCAPFVVIDSDLWFGLVRVSNSKGAYDYRPKTDFVHVKTDCTKWEKQ